MITFFTIVLDGQPWISRHLEAFEKLPFDWRWIIVEGVADSANCTSWCSRIAPRLSRDGTSQYLHSIAGGNVTVLKQPLWPGKVAMCNAALSLIKEPCLLWQVDADEVWSTDQIVAVKELFDRNPTKNCAYFWCRYWVGPKVIVTSRNTWGNNSTYEWHRVWRFEPGMRFQTHEPPALSGFTENPLLHAETEAVGAVFEHYAYATLQQVQFKQVYYGSKTNPVGHHYRHLVANWHRLNANTRWPVHLQEFFHFVPDDVIADHVDPSEHNVNRHRQLSA